MEDIVHKFSFVAAMVAALVTSLFIGCSKTDEATGGTKPAGQSYHIGFAMTLNDPYWQNMQLGAQDEAKKLGATVTILNAEEDVQKQAQQINDLMAQGVDAVCLV